MDTQQVVVKRGRGRPRKDSVVQSIAVGSAADNAVRLAGTFLSDAESELRIAQTGEHVIDPRGRTVLDDSSCAVALVNARAHVGNARRAFERFMVTVPAEVESRMDAMMERIHQVSETKFGPMRFASRLMAGKVYRV